MRKEKLAYEVGYRVNEEGEIFNPKGMKLKVTSVNNKRYPQVNFKYKDKKYYVRMHRIAAYCFYGDEMFEENVVVRHLNDDKTDISKQNIALGTQAENMADMSEESRLISSEKKRAYAIKNDIIPPRNTKILDEIIPEIITLLDRGYSYRKLADKYDVHHSTIYYINKTRRNSFEQNKRIG